jgi:hypothetical protein
VGKVAVVDLETFKVTQSVEAGKNPVRIRSVVDLPHHLRAI